MSNKHIEARVVSIAPLTDSILQLFLMPEVFVPYEAGQYLQIITNHEPVCYSIANAPLGSHQYELHIRHGRDNPSNKMLSDIKQQGSVFIQLPFGDCKISRLQPNKPILFIAGGTGFSPIKAMIEQLLAESAPAPFDLIWTARTKSDLYMEEKVLYWQSHVANFSYMSQLSELNENSLVSIAIDRHKKQLNELQIVISGPFDMAYSIRDQLLSHGVLRENIFSDAFSFEK